MKNEQIEVVKKWLELTSIRDIQLSIGFANFYQCFIRGFSRIAAPLTSILKTTWSSAKLAIRAFRAGNNEIVGGGCGRADETVVNLSKNKKSMKLTYMPNIGAMRRPNFLTPNAKKAFNHLRLAFIKASILQHFNSECHIQIETDALSYAISGILS